MAAKKTAEENTGFEIAPGFEVPLGWEDESVGFPPYWSPAPGAAFRGKLMLRDDRDPEFVRYVFQNTNNLPLECATGKTDDAEQVMVQPGELFTVSLYAALPFDMMFGLECLLLAKDKVETSKAGREVWRWRMILPPEAKKQLHERRQTASLQAAQSAAMLGAKKDSTSVIQ